MTQPEHLADCDGNGFVRCWNGCDDGYFDGYEEDPLWYEPGDLVMCDVCEGHGGWKCPACSESYADHYDPDAEVKFRRENPREDD